MDGGAAARAETSESAESVSRWRIGTAAGAARGLSGFGSGLLEQVERDGLLGAGGEGAERHLVQENRPPRLIGPFQPERRQVVEVGVVGHGRERGVGIDPVLALV